MRVIYLLCGLVMVHGEATKDSLKDEYCTDPRTMRKHAAYTEWADAYSCTRHRCQPGGRNLAIYTVGCKRVEAPESAIECEEVVEDTNMQFPYCCTRLRCLVVVRGEVWTRVLGQPWETLPAAPWSHMYKMKKPPPVDGGFLPKVGPAAGPVYELAEDAPVDRRAGMEKDKPSLRAAPAPSVPDIVIALTTNSEKKPTETEIKSKLLSRADEDRDQPNEIEAEEAALITEKVPEILSEERMYGSEKKSSRDRKFADTSDDEPNYNRGARSHKMEAGSDERFFPKAEKNSRVSATWAQIPQKLWNNGPNVRSQPRPDTHVEPFPDSEEKQDKPASLQHLVNAIGTRMRDIENVVQQMSEKVQPPDSVERMRADRSAPHPKVKESELTGKPKQPNIDKYNRFPSKQGGSKYLHATADATTEVPLYVGDSMNGYFSDASNNLQRRSMSNRSPKEPRGTYMVPVNTDHKKTGAESGETEMKRKKHTHKKKKSKHGHRKHRREDREKKSSRILEEKNTLSAEEVNDFGTGTGQEVGVTSLPLRLERRRHSIFVPRQPMSYRQMVNPPIAIRRPRKYLRPNIPRRIHLKFETYRYPLINYLRNYRSNRDRYRAL